MSLLLDALKRAEQEKLARQAESPPPAAPRTNASMQAANAPNLELQPIDPAAGVALRSDAQSAQAMFDAKTAARPPAEDGKKSALLAALGAIAVIVIAAGAYVWYSIQTLAPKSLATAGPLRPPPAPTPPPASGLSPSGLATPAAPTAGSAPGTVPPAPPPPRFEPAPASPATATPTPVPEGAPARNRPAPQAAQRLAMDLLRGAPAEAPVKLERSADAAKVPANISQGYAALREGDLPAARRGYAAAVAADSGSVDARLGLATVEARTGNRAAASVHYRKALDLDPRNATALAGLASLADFTRPEAVEAQLRMDLDRNPDSAALHLSLGNLYASQARWSEAQRSFFEAHRLQAGSADTLFNLAVSLDHLGQARLAGEYYRLALEAARGQATQFDPALVSRRLAEMKP